MNKLLTSLTVLSLIIVAVLGIDKFVNLGVFNNIETTIRIFSNLSWYLMSFTVATIFTGYLIIAAKEVKVVFRFFAIPAWLAFSLSMLFAVDNFFGYGYPAIPPKAELLSYRVITDPDTRERTIESWMYLEEQNRTRVYTFPYQTAREEALYKAMQLKATGERILVDLKPTKTEGELSQIAPDDMIFYDIRYKGMGEKNYAQGTLQGGNNAGEENISLDPPPTGEEGITLTVPGGSEIIIERGQTFRVTPEGEIEVLEVEDPRYNGKDWTPVEPPTIDPNDPNAPRIQRFQ